MIWKHHSRTGGDYEHYLARPQGLAGTDWLYVLSDTDRWCVCIYIMGKRSIYLDTSLQILETFNQRDAFVFPNADEAKEACERYYNLMILR